MATVIKRNGSENWFARFRVDGRDYTVSTGTSNKRDAQTIMARLVAEAKGTRSFSEMFDDLLAELDRQAKAATSDVRKNELLVARRDMARRLLGAQDEKLAIADAWQAWLDSPKKRNPGPATVAQYRAEWDRFTSWAQPQHLKHLHDVTPGTAEAYAAELWKSNVTPGTYNAHLNFLKSLFNVLKVRGGLVANPWGELRTMTNEREGRRMFTQDELTRLAVGASGTLRYWLAIGLYTGLRLGDVVNLRWDAVKLDGFIELTPMKTARLKKKVRIPLHPVLDAMLKELRATTSGGEYLFPEDRTAYRLDRSSASARFQALLKQCGIVTTEAPAEAGHRRRSITRCGFHSLRHSFVSLCAANRVPQVAIMELVGHGSPAMTQLYSHAGDEQKTAAIATLPAFAFASNVNAIEGEAVNDEE